MTKEQIYYEMDACLEHGNINCFKDQLDELFDNFVEEESVDIIAEFIYKRYTTYKAESMAKILEIVIKKKPSITLIKYPNNPLFKLSIIKGSMDLFDCFIEEGIEPFLKDKDEDFEYDYFMELNVLAEDLHDTFFTQYVRCIKGMDFNGGFKQDDNPNFLSINVEDFDTMDDVVEKYNTIIGRRDILKKLEQRMSI